VFGAPLCAMLLQLSTFLRFRRYLLSTTVGKPQPYAFYQPKSGFLKPENQPFHTTQHFCAAALPASEKMPAIGANDGPIAHEVELEPLGKASASNTGTQRSVRSMTATYTPTSQSTSSTLVHEPIAVPQQAGPPDMYPESARQRAPLSTRWIAVPNVWTRRGMILAKMAVAVTTLVLASVALWPSIRGSQDGHQSLQLAAWTAQKEFYDWCEGVSFAFALWFLAWCIEAKWGLAAWLDRWGLQGARSPPTFTTASYQRAGTEGHSRPLGGGLVGIAVRCVCMREMGQEAGTGLLCCGDGLRSALRRWNSDVSIVGSPWSCPLS